MASFHWHMEVLEILQFHVNVNEGGWHFVLVEWIWVFNLLTNWSLNEMTAILKTFSNIFSWMKNIKFGSYSTGITWTNVDQDSWHIASLSPQNGAGFILTFPSHTDYHAMCPYIYLHFISKLLDIFHRSNHASVSISHFVTFQGLLILNNNTRGYKWHLAKWHQQNMATSKSLCAQSITVTS